MLILKKFLRDVPAVLGFVIIVFVVLVALLSPVLVPDKSVAYDSNILMRLQPPSSEHWFGTDNLGRDILARVILGTQGALMIALSVVGIAILIGVPLGLVAGYRGGWLGDVIMRLTDVFLAVPQLILAVALAQLLSRGITSAMLALALTYWPFFARTV